MMAMEIRPLSTALGAEVTIRVAKMGPALGAEILDIDLRREFSEPEKEALREAWGKNLVLVARGLSDFTADQQKAFCRVFGEIGSRARPVEGQEAPAEAGASSSEVMYISNKQIDGRFIGRLPDGEMQFHIDQSYTARPAKGACLYAVEVPPTGGDTMFCNLYRAYDELPAALRHYVDGKNAWHVFGHGGYGITSREANTPETATQKCLHPMVPTHPDTRRKLLYVSRLMTARIDGVPEDESEDILMQLFEHQEREEFRYTHKWRPGDMLLWDNRCSIHARTDFDPSHTRHLRRFTIRGDETTGGLL
jgi:taurine dioxygenase